MATRAPAPATAAPVKAEPEPVAPEAASAPAPAPEAPAGPLIGFIEAISTQVGVRDPNQVLALIELHASEVIDILAQRIGKAAVLSHTKGSKS